MYVGVYRVELHLPAGRSLKDKRSVVQRLRSRLGRLNLSVAEIEDQDLWQSCVLGVSAVSSDPGYLDNLAGTIESVCLKDPRAQLLRVRPDVFPVEP